MVRAVRVRHRGWGAAVVAVGLTLAGCGDDEPEDPFAATTTAPILLGDDAVSTTTTATTTPPTFPPLGPDPFAVPADDSVITEVYVEAVLNELSRLDGDALRLSVAEGLVPTEAIASKTSSRPTSTRSRSTSWSSSQRMGSRG